MRVCDVAGVLPGDIRFALMDGAPEPICRKMLEGRVDWPKVEDNRGRLRTERRTADIPCKPAQQEF